MNIARELVMASRCRPSASPTSHLGGWGLVNPLVSDMQSAQRAWTSLKGEALGGRDDFAKASGTRRLPAPSSGDGKEYVAEVQPEHVSALFCRQVGLT